MWQHPPKSSFLSFLGDLKKKKRICVKIFCFQKTVLPFDYFSSKEIKKTVEEFFVLKKNPMLGPGWYEKFKNTQY